MKFNIVLVHPEIPQNTGSIGRMCVSTDTALHLIRPLGFSLDDKYLKRAGMDYWPEVELYLYDSWDEFLDRNNGGRLFFFTTKSDKEYYDASFRDGDYLIFGCEGAGLPKEFYEKYADDLLTIPMHGRYKRSLNLACSTAIVLFEALRQNR